MRNNNLKKSHSEALKQLGTVIISSNSIATIWLTVLLLVAQVLYIFGTTIINLTFHLLRKKNNRYGILNMSDGTITYKFL